jgi:putative transposase
MTSSQVAELLAFLGIGRTHSRPHVSNDNPYSEAQFKALKYCPAFPERFGCIEDAQVFCQAFFAYYCHEHRHSGIGYHTPASVHFGTAEEVRAKRAETLNAVYAAPSGSATAIRWPRSCPPSRGSTSPPSEATRRRIQNVLSQSG